MDERERERERRNLCSSFSLGVQGFKIASGEITNFPLLRKIAQKRKPMILSTGMSSLVEGNLGLQDFGCWI
jgi:N-acetylneuraminate synthase/N,N'-diacetyllegionaminate synthase